MSQARYFAKRKLVPVLKTTAKEALSLRPSAAFMQIAEEALRVWIAREKWRAEVIVKAESRDAAARADNSVSF